MKIREFQDCDKDQVIKLWNDCELIVPQNDPEKDIDRKIKVNPELFLVGELDSEIVASVMGGYEGHRGWVNYLSVKPGKRNLGLGKEIMREIESRLKKKGCPKINLQVRSTNTKVIAFYESLGYSNDNVVGLGKRIEND